MFCSIPAHSKISAITVTRPWMPFLIRPRVEQDVSKRIQLYQQAEQIIVQDAPAMFISHDVTYTLVKPYVKGFVLTPIDIPIERYLWLQH